MTGTVRLCDACEQEFAEWLVHRDIMVGDDEPETSVLCDNCWQEYIKHPMVTQWSAQSGVSVVTSARLKDFTLPEEFCTDEGD